MSKINHIKSDTFSVSTDTETKKTVKPRKSTKCVVATEQSGVSYTKLPTKRLDRTVSMEKISKKRR